MVVEQGHLEEDPEPRHEEHHLRGDEHDHAVAQAYGDHRRVVAGIGFLGDVHPPADHGVDHAGEADDDRPPCVLGQAEQALHVDDRAERQHQGRDRADQRPGARVDQVVVVLDVLVGHVGAVLR